MPRPKKKSELVNIPLEIAYGKLSRLEKLAHPLIRLRVRQAIRRHPDMQDLLEPILEELDAHAKDVRTAQVALSTVKSLLKKLL